MSETVWLGIIALINTAMASAFAYATVKLNKKTGEVLETGKKTLYHVNSGSLGQAGLYKLMSQRMAEITKDPVDIQVAEAAKKIFDEKTTEQEQLRKAEEKKGATE